MKITKYINTVLRGTQKRNKYWHTYLFLAIIRIILVFFPQIGYIHPDEFFQSVEILLGDQFEIEHKRSWEFNNTFPIRSMAIQYFIIKIPLNILDFVSVYTKYYLDINLKTSYIFLIYPRFIYCILSFLNDWSLYKICEVYSLHHEIRLLTLGSSFIMLIFSTRTFSNTIEMTVCSILLYIVADCMIKSNTIIYKKEFLQDKYQNATSTGEKVKLYKLKAALPSHSYSKVICMANLCVIGIFNRPTFIIFGSPIIFFWLLRGMGSKTVSFFDFNVRIFLFILCTIPATIFFVIVDSLYYKYLTLGEIHMLDVSIDNFIFVPWNFVKYNIDPTKTAEHGIHPKYTHALINIPLLYNILGVITFFSFGILIYRFLRGQYRYLPRSQSIIGLMSSAIFVPLAILSLINHQEPRFLLPLTLPIILLHSPKLITGFCTTYPFKVENLFLRWLYDNFLSSKASSKHLLKLWYTFNIFLTIFFGFIHQAGVIQLTQHFSDIMITKQKFSHIHLITSHIYSVPESFLNIPNSNILYTNRETNKKYYRNKEFYLYEYGSMDLNKLLYKIKLILDLCEMKYTKKNLNYQLYLTIPNTLNDNFLNILNQTNNTIIVNYHLIKTFYPHLSTEAMPKMNIFKLFYSYYYEQNEENYINLLSVMNRNLSIFNIMDWITSTFQQFGLNLYRIEAKKIIM